MTLTEAIKILQKKFGPAILLSKEFRGEHTLVIKKDSLLQIMQHCHDLLHMDYLVDISSVDHFGEEPRFEMVYELYSYTYRFPLRIKTAVSEEDLEVPTLSSLWPTADWHEREIYDMMGIRFKNHPDLRRILMWEGYPYYPLRKDFPLAGKPSEMPEVAFSEKAPLAGGPFVTQPGTGTAVAKEPRSRE